MTARRAGKYSYADVRIAALGLLKNKPVTEVISGALSFQQIRERLMHDPAGGRVWDKYSSVETAVLTAMHRDGDEWSDKLPPKMWFANDLAFMLEVVDLRLRTSAEAIAPLIELLDAQTLDPQPWPDPRVEDAVCCSFLNALDAVDQETGLGRADLLPFRSYAGPELPLRETFREFPDLAQQISDHQRFWADLLGSYERELMPDLHLPDLLATLGALEDGYLAQAVGMGSSQEHRFAERFAHGVQAILAGTTLATRSRRNMLGNDGQKNGGDLASGAELKDQSC